MGGFVTKDGKAYVSDFPDVLIDLVGYRDPDEAPDDGGGIPAYTAETDLTPLIITTDEATGVKIVVLRPDDNSAFGTIGTTDWHGVVRFRWNATDMLYRSEPFEVRLNKTVVVANNGANGVSSAITVRFPAIETTRAEHGYCFLMSSSINNTQAIKGANDANAFRFRPRIPIEMLDISASVGSRSYFEMDCAYRIMVGGQFAFPGPCKDVALEDYFLRIEAVKPSKLAAHYEVNYQDQLEEMGDPAFVPNTNRLSNPQILYARLFEAFELLQHDNFPRVMPQNFHPGAVWEGFTVIPEPTVCMSPCEFDANPLVDNPATDYNQGFHLIAKYLIQLGMANGTAPDAEWAGTALPLYAPNLAFEETDVKHDLVRDHVRPIEHKDSIVDPSDDLYNLTNPLSYWSWLKNSLPEIELREDPPIRCRLVRPIHLHWQRPEQRATLEPTCRERGDSSDRNSVPAKDQLHWVQGDAHPQPKPDTIPGFRSQSFF